MTYALVVCDPTQSERRLYAFALLILDGYGTLLLYVTTACQRSAYGYHRAGC